MEILNSYIGMQIRVVTFDANHSITDSTQSISASIRKLADAEVKAFSTDRHSTESVLGETTRLSVRLRLDFEFDT